MLLSDYKQVTPATRQRPGAVTTTSWEAMMGRTYHDLMGQRFGRWTVIGTGTPIRGRGQRWLCRCDCGTERMVMAGNLLSGTSTSCGNQRVPLEKRFWAKVDKTPGHGPHGFCWRWTACLNSDGYGNTNVGGRAIAAHRVAYEMLVEPVPAGLELDHLCSVRNCVNPAHLEPVTHAENVRRGGSYAALKKARDLRRTDVCPLGHSMTGDNLYIQVRADAPGGMRSCRICRRDAAKRSYEKRMRAAS